MFGIPNLQIMSCSDGHALCYYPLLYSSALHTVLLAPRPSSCIGSVILRWTIWTFLCKAKSHKWIEKNGVICWRPRGTSARKGHLSPILFQRHCEVPVSRPAHTAIQHGIEKQWGIIFGPGGQFCIPCSIWSHHTWSPCWTGMPRHQVHCWKQ